MRRRFLKGGIELAIGHVTQQALLLLRNVLIARLIGPEDFGIAVTFAIVISVLEVVSDVGVEQFIVRSPDGEAPELQSTLHSVVMVRGILIGLGIFLSADLFTWVFNIPEVAWVYRCLALVPVIKGFAHLDMRRFQRGLRYRPSVGVEVASLFASFVTAIVLGIVLRSYEAMLWAYLVQVVVAVGASHLVAQRPYRLAFHRPVLLRLFVFGMPLVLNGMVLFAVGQGDRIIVGSQLGMHDLANYAVAAIITGGASLLVIKMTGSLYVPVLSDVLADPVAFDRRYQICGAISAFAAFGIVFPLVVAGPKIINVFYGDSYNVPALVVAWLGVLAGATVLRSLSVAGALATGDTKDILYSNCFRFVGLALSFLAIIIGYGAIGVATSMAVGELFAAGFSLVRADLRSMHNSRTGTRLFVAYIILGVVSVAPYYAGLYTGSKFQQFAVIGLLLFFGFIVVIAAVTEFRKWSRGVLQDFVDGGLGGLLR